MRLSFHGAARNVTGSCFLVECSGKRILIDCGLYQGDSELKDTNAEPFGFDPKGIDFLLLTHAHLDHCGRIPLLAKQGFRGEIITTAASSDLARLIMLDSASLQEDEARYRARRELRRRNKKHVEEVQPLYTVVDALSAIEFFGRSAAYDLPLELAPGITATFLDTGHILGSANILLELNENGRSKRVLFSGDIGCAGRPILRDPSPAPPADIVVMETTYGDRNHRSLDSSLEELYEAISEAFQHGGNVIIPVFALERAQEMLYFLHEAIEAGSLPRNIQVFLDSPMAISATEIFMRHQECFTEQAAALLRDSLGPFNLPGLHYTRETAESIAINRLVGGAVIMAGSGMCTGGRVRHHLKHNLWRRDSSVIFVGYAVRGTLARTIIDGAASVRIYGEEIRVLAHIYTINGFSAHAGQEDLLAWHANTGEPEKTFLVHGEKDVMEIFAKRLKDTEVLMPKRHEVFKI